MTEAMFLSSSSIHSAVYRESHVCICLYSDIDRTYIKRHRYRYLFLMYIYI